MKATKIFLMGTFILFLSGMTMSNSVLACDPNADYGSRLVLSIRDCIGIADEDICAALTSPTVFYNESCLGTEQDESISDAGFGSADGSIQYNGPAALPTIRQTSLTTVDSRNGATVESWQLYTYEGASPTILPIVTDVSYEYSGGIGFANEPGEGWGFVNIVVWDASKIAVADFPPNHPSGYRLTQANCGNESDFSLEDGAIIANDVYVTDGGPAFPFTLDLTTGCDGNPVMVNPGDSFIVTTMSQAIADRGGYFDMGHTVAVKFADDTPPEVLMALVDNIEPACDECGLEQLNARIKTGGNSCLEPDDDGMIFVSIFGSDSMDVSTIRTDESLVLGSLDISLNTQLHKCKEKNINKDDFVDLTCKFKHGVLEANNEETIELLLRGKLIDGTRFEGVDTVDSICLGL